MSERAPYSRVYWTVRNDPRLESIYPDDHHWATWNRLLLAADMAWPAPADLPSTARRASLKALEAAGVIEILPGGLFRFHGLDAERGRRTESARTSAGHRWQTERNANASRSQTERHASRDETRRDETSSARAREGLADITPAVELMWTNASGKSVLGSGQYAQDYLDDACRRHGEQAVIAAIIQAREGFAHVPATQPLTVAVRNLLDPLPSSKDTQAAEAEERERVRARRAVERTIRTAHETGWHDGAPDSRCPLCPRDDP